MGMFDLSGRLLIVDAFTNTMNALRDQSGMSAKALAKLGQTTDMSMKKAGDSIKELEARLAGLQAKAKTPDFTVGDADQFNAVKGSLVALKKTVAEANGEVGEGGLLTSLGSVQTAFRAVAASAAVLATVKFATQAFELAKMGAAAMSTATAFDNLATASGVSSGKLLTDMRKASRGTMSDMQAMVTANRSMMSSGGDIAKELPRLMEIARSSALATGQDVEFVMSTLVKGILKYQPLLIDNADIYLKIAPAVDAYAAAVGKTTQELTAQEKQLAVLNAVLEQGGAFMKQMGLEGTTAADKMQSLPAAITNIKNAWGELLVQKGAADFVGGTSAELQAWADSTRSRAELEALILRLREQGNEEAARELETAKELTGQMIRQAMFDSTMGEGQREAVALLDPLIEKYAGVADEADLVAYSLTLVGETALKNKTTVDAAAQATLTYAEKMKTFTEAAGAAKGKLSALTAGAGAFAEIAGTLAALSTMMPEMPEMPTSLVNLDATKIKAFRDAVMALNPLLEDEADALNTSLAAAEAQQKAMLSVGSSMESLLAPVDRLKLIATVFDGGTGSLITLLKGFDGLSKETQDLLVDQNLLNRALLEMNALAAKPVSIGVVGTEIVSAYDQIDKFAEKLASSGAMSIEEAGRFAAEAKAKVSEAGVGLVGETKLTMDTIMGVTVDSVKQTADAVQAEYDRIKAVITSMQELGQNLPKMPDAPDNIMKLDVSVYERWAASIDPANVALATNAQKLIDAANAAKETQLAVLASTYTNYDYAVSLARIAVAAGITDGSILELAQNFQKLAPNVQDRVVELDGLGYALDELRDKASEPVTIDIQVKGAEAAINKLNSLATSMAVSGALTFEEARQWDEKTIIQAQDFSKTMVGLSKWEQDAKWAIWLAGHTKRVDAVNDEQEEAEKAASKHFSTIADSASELQSMIEAALGKGLAVTETDMLNTLAGTYEDKALENARRLDAIAARGFKELKAHPDWAGLLEIPGDVLSGSEAALKAWSANMRDRVVDLTEPDKINWEAFIANFKQQLNDKQAREITIDMAVSKLNAEGLLSGSEEERRKQVLKALGIDDPELRISALFSTGTGAGAALRKELAGDGTEIMKIQAELVFAHAAGAGEQQGTGAMLLDSITRAYFPLSQTPDDLLGGTDMQSKGQLAGIALGEGIGDGMATVDVYADILSTLSTIKKDDQDKFKAIGKQIGEYLSDSYIDAFLGGADDVIDHLANKLVGPVSDRMGRRGGVQP